MCCKRYLLFGSTEKRGGTKTSSLCQVESFTFITDWFLLENVKRHLKVRISLSSIFTIWIRPTSNNFFSNVILQKLIKNSFRSSCQLKILLPFVLMCCHVAVIVAFICLFEALKTFSSFSCWLYHFWGKVPVTGKVYEFSYLRCRISQCFIIYSNKFIAPILR